MTRADLSEFLVIGIQARTSNAREATLDGIIPKQWQSFLQMGVLQQIPNKASSNIYVLYTDYENGRIGEYSYVVGAMVQEKTVPPAGMVARTVPGGRYSVLTSQKGPVANVIPAAWQEVWTLENEGKIKRAYKTDFEIYDERSRDPRNAQVDLYIGTD